MSENTGSVGEKDPTEELRKAIFQQFTENSENRSKLKNTTTLSERKNEGKLRFDLVPPEVEKALAEVLTYGTTKYADRNWEKGNLYSVPYASLRRHLNSWYAGEDIDPESGLSNLKLLLMNVAMLVFYEEHHPHLDDRPKKKK